MSKKQSKRGNLSIPLTKTASETVKTPPRAGIYPKELLKKETISTKPPKKRNKKPKMAKKAK